MSNELNVAEIAYGILDPGMEVELYFWSDSNYPSYPQEYNILRQQARFFTISPEPTFFEPSGQFELEPVVNLEITRVWNTVWTTLVPNQFSGEVHYSYQYNVAIKNIGWTRSAFHLIQAVTLAKISPLTGDG